MSEHQYDNPFTSIPLLGRTSSISRGPEPAVLGRVLGHSDDERRLRLVEQPVLVGFSNRVISSYEAFNRLVEKRRTACIM